jgi:HK97 family phage prohead protease
VDELRTFDFRAEVRDDGAGLNLDGYALTFDDTYDMGPFRERIDGKAFNKTLADGGGRGGEGIPLLVNHDGIPLANTRVGHAWSLKADSRGLRTTTPEGKPLDAANPKVQEVASAMNRGDLNKMSFAFETLRDAWEDEPEDGLAPIRTVQEVRLWDVSLVTTPANPGTSAELRSVAAVAFCTASNKRRQTTQ